MEDYEDADGDVDVDPVDIDLEEFKKESLVIEERIKKSQLEEIHKIFERAARFAFLLQNYQ